MDQIEFLQLFLSKTQRKPTPKHTSGGPPTSQQALADTHVARQRLLKDWKLHHQLKLQTAVLAHPKLSKYLSILASELPGTRLTPSGTADLDVCTLATVYAIPLMSTEAREVALLHTRRWLNKVHKKSGRMQPNDPLPADMGGTAVTDLERLRSLLNL